MKPKHNTNIGLKSWLTSWAGLSWISGSVLIIVSAYFIGNIIPSLDNSIESIDLNISILDDHSTEIKKIMDTTTQKETNVYNTINTMQILENLPQSESVKTDYETIERGKILFYSDMLYPLMRINGENIENYIEKGKYGNYSFDLKKFMEYINRIGENKTTELLREQYGKATDGLNALNNEKKQLESQKAELIKERKQTLKLASIFQIFGLVLAFLGDILSRREKNEK